MATSETIESQRKGAEIHHGEAPCLQKLHELLDEFAVPRCLVRVSEIEELGFNRSTGFCWLKQKAKTDCKIPGVAAMTYDVIVTYFFQQRRMTKMTGVKAKVMLVAVSIADVLVGAPSSDKVTFATPKGTSRVYPLAAFERAVVDKK